MEETTILLWVLGISGALWIITFALAVRTVDKSRKKVRLRLEKASEVTWKINNDEKGYFCRYAPLDTIIDASGNEVSISDDEDHKIIFRGLTPDSRVPSKAYVISVEEASFKHGSRGETLNTLQFFVCPKNASHYRWVIQSVNEKGIFCVHPIMGDVFVRLDEEQLSVLKVGMAVMIKQCAEQVGDNYRLTYKYFGFIAR